ncbi:MAG: hypothetical protein R3F46_12980 [bacterium]
MGRSDSPKAGAASPRQLLLQAAVTLLLCWVAFRVASTDRSPTPCGVPLPDVPQLVTDVGKVIEDLNIMERQIPTTYLQFMAPQPDGIMPLRYPLDVRRADFSLELPMGTTSLPMGDSFEEDAVDSQVIFQYKQQLDYIKISMPPRYEGESITDFVARARKDYEGLGASFRPGKDPLEFNGMIFQHFEYSRPTQYEAEAPPKDMSHYIYFAPAGSRVLVMDFLTTPERHEEARPLVEKIMRSIEPGERFLQQMQLEYPARLGTNSDNESLESEADPRADESASELQ